MACLALSRSAPIHAMRASSVASRQPCPRHSRTVVNSSRMFLEQLTVEILVAGFSVSVGISDFYERINKINFRPGWGNPG